jgi:hypothetical protein
MMQKDINSMTVPTMEELRLADIVLPAAWKIVSV